MAPASRYFDAITSAAFAPAILAGAFAFALAILNVTPGSLAGIVPVVLLTFVVALAHAVILGLPTMLILHRLGWANSFTALAAGFVIGVVPYASTTAIWTSATANGMTFDLQAWWGVDGRVGELKVGGIAGLCGAAGGLTGWLTLNGGTRASWAWNQALGAATVALALAAVSPRPWAMVDRSCHNPMRDGRNSIGPELSAGLRLEPDEWPALADAFEAFAQSNDWTFRDSSRSDPPTLRLSVCSEEGTQIQTLEMGAPRSGSLRDVGVLVFAYQPQGGANWEAPTRRLIEAIEERWPGKVLFIDRMSHEIPRPDFLTPTGGEE